MTTFENKTVLITGASGGIGESLARQLAAKKADLILSARSKDKLEKLASELVSEHKIRAYAIPSDLSAPGAPIQLVETIQDKGLSVDILINNAGFGGRGLFHKMSFDSVKEMMRLNMNALVELTHLLLPKMVEKKSGGVINVASTASFQPIPYLGLYAATKAFVLSFTEALWAEHDGSGVRIFCLCPGNTVTQFHHVAGIEKKKVFLPASADDVARYTIERFEKSNAASGIHGFLNRIVAFSNRLSPRKLVLLIASRIYKTP